MKIDEYYVNKINIESQLILFMKGDEPLEEVQIFGYGHSCGFLQHPLSIKNPSYFFWNPREIQSIKKYIKKRILSGSPSFNIFEIVFSPVREQHEEDWCIPIPLLLNYPVNSLFSEADENPKVGRGSYYRHVFHNIISEDNKNYFKIVGVNKATQKYLMETEYKIGIPSDKEMCRIMKIDPIVFAGFRAFVSSFPLLTAWASCISSLYLEVWGEYIDEFPKVGEENWKKYIILEDS